MTARRAALVLLLAGACGRAGDDRSEVLPGDGVSPSADGASALVDAPPPPTPRAPFAFAILPDTQIATQDYPELFEAETRWIADHHVDEDLAFVLHVGDVVEWPVRDADWTKARRAMATLDGVVPYAIAIGNHDLEAHTTNSIATDRTATRFNATFPRAHFAAMRAFVESFPATASDNTAFQLTAGGTDWLIVVLKYQPTDDELTWAAGVIAREPRRQVVILTHDYMNGTTRSVAGARIWERLARPSSNVVLIVNGHFVSTGRRDDPADDGHVVHQIMADYQDYDRRDPNGYLRVFRFDPDAESLSVRTYSPSLDRALADDANQFTIPFALARGAARVRRHLESRAALDAWGFRDVEVTTVPDAVLDGWPVAAPWPSKPETIRVGTAPAVYVLDGAITRRVPTAQAMTAWGRTFAAVRATTAEELARTPPSTDLPAYPVLVKGSGPAVYVLDVAD